MIFSSGGLESESFLPGIFIFLLFSSKPILFFRFFSKSASLPRSWKRSLTRPSLSEDPAFGKLYRYHELTAKDDSPLESETIWKERVKELHCMYGSHIHLLHSQNFPPPSTQAESNKPGEDGPVAILGVFECNIDRAFLDSIFPVLLP